MHKEEAQTQVNLKDYLIINILMYMNAATDLMCPCTSPEEVRGMKGETEFTLFTCFLLEVSIIMTKQKIYQLDLDIARGIYYCDRYLSRVPMYPNTEIFCWP